MPTVLHAIYLYVGLAQPRLRAHRVVAVGVIRDGEITRDENVIGELQQGDRVEILPLERVGEEERVSNFSLEVWSFDLAPTGETWSR